jgi:preprotein translocase SecE subunit
MTNPIQAIRTIYQETVAELKKCTWPTRKELYEYVSVVLSGLVIFTVTVMVYDIVFQFAVKYITGMN